jgi:hypothetical protein
MSDVPSAVGCGSGSLSVDEPFSNDRDRQIFALSRLALSRLALSRLALSLLALPLDARVRSAFFDLGKSDNDGPVV